MAICSAEPFDLVLSDVMMPDVDGHTLAQWVAKNYPSTRNALMPAYDKRCRCCRYSPPCKLLSKPFTPGGAIAFVRGVLEPSGALSTPQDSPPNSAA